MGIKYLEKFRVFGKHRLERGTVM